MSAPRKYLNRAEERKLIKKAQAGDRSAADALVMNHLGALSAKAIQFCRKNKMLDKDDLIQESVSYFTAAIYEFDLKRKFRLCTFALNVVKRRLIDYVYSITHLVTVPRTTANAYRRGQGKDEYTRFAVLAATSPMKALGGVGGTEVGVGTRLGDHTNTINERIDLEQCFGKLSPKAQIVVRRLYAGDATDDIAADLGLKRHNIHQLHANALKRLRVLMKVA